MRWVFKTSRHVWRFLRFMTGALILVVLALLFRLQAAPVDITPYVPHFLNYAGLNQLELQVDKLYLGYDEELVIHGYGLKLRSAKLKGEFLNLREFQLFLSNRNLILGRPVAKHAEIVGARVPAVVSHDGVSVAGLFIVKSFAGPDEEPPGLVEVLNRLSEKSTSYAYLKTLRIKQLDATLEDQAHSQHWRIHNASLDFNKSPDYGENIRLDGILTPEQDKQQRTPVSLQLSHAYKANTVQMDVLFDSAGPALLQNYLPVQLAGLVQSDGGRVDLNFEVGLRNALSQPKFSAEFGRSSIHIPSTYNLPLRFKSLHVQGHYDETSDQMRLKKLVAQDVNDLKIKASGRIDGLENGELYLDLSLNTPKAALDHGMNYIPDQVLPETVNWVRSNIYHTQAHDVYLEYKGDPRKLPHCGDSCGFYGHFDFKGMTIRFLPDLPPLENVGGRFTLGGSSITVHAPKAQLQAQTVEDVSLTITNMFKGKPSKLHGEGHFSGPIQGVINLVSMKLKDKNWIEPVSGTHTSQFVFNQELDTPDPFSGIQFNLDARLMDIGTNVPELAGHTFEAPIAKLEMNQDKLTLKADGKLDNIPAEVVWQENMRAPGQQSKVDIKSIVPAQVVKPYLNKASLNAKGDFLVRTQIHKKPKDFYEFNAHVRIGGVSISAPQLGWQKDAQAPGDLKVKGRMHANVFPLTFESISLTAPQLDISGEMSLSQPALESATINLERLHVSRTDVSLHYDGDVFDVKGESLDMSFLKGDKSVSRTLNFDAFIPHGRIMLSLNSLWLKMGVLNQVSGYAQAESGVWRTAQFEALTNGNPLAINLDYALDGQQQFQVSMGDVGQTLRTFDIYPNMRSGKGTFVLNISQTKPLKASGRLLAEDVRVVNAPILARLLSLISPPQLLSAGKGILFSDVEVPISISRTHLYFNNAKLDGPSIGLNFAGSFDLAAEKMAIDGQLLPVSGLNQMFDFLPLVGGVLTGSQEGLVVADFSIDGPVKDPKVFVNPFSVVTPGLVKDIFGFILPFGKDRQEPQEAP